MTVAAASGPKPDTPDSPVAERAPIARFVGLFVVVLAIATSFTSFLVLTGQTSIQPTPDVVRTAGIINGVVVLLLIAIVAFEASGLVVARRKGRAGARLHVRIVLFFSFIAAVPAVLMATLASITLDKGLDRWFAERTEAIIDTSRAVAQAYVQEHSRALGQDLVAIAGEFNRVTPDLEANASAISAYLTNQGRLRGLSTIRLIRRDRSTVVEGETTTNIEVPPPPEEAFADAEDGRPSLIAPGTTNLVGGLIKLTGFDNIYLYLARPIDPRVTRYLRLTEENAAEYEQLQANRFGVQVAFAILFIGMALVVLLSAIWIGLGFARSLVSPIRRLIGAAQQVSGGNLDVHVPARRSTGDLAALASTFNTMTSQLKSQRSELLAANDKIDERRRFTEAVLSGVSAGVFGLDEKGQVTLVNRFALAALGLGEGDLVGKPLGHVVPELDPVLEEAWQQRSRGPAHAQIQLIRNNEQRTFNVQVTQERSRGKIEGLVVTLDDITDLMAAQRRSAWADVARRIAHEIKNPLTPIQLSAERLKRRFGARVEEEDRKVFDQCTETIVRQVGDIRRMVDEFSGFARMPKPVMERRDLNEVVREAVFLQEVGNPNIRFKLELPEHPVMARVDHRLVTQALTNVVKNATEAIEGVGRGDAAGLISVNVYDRPGEAVIDVEDNGKGLPSEDREKLLEPYMTTREKGTGGGPVIDVEDNGKGLPSEDREKLLEPYMTTREKGTGLGLAIVRKIMEEHGGSIALLDAHAVANGGRGALVRLVFPAPNETEDDARAEAGGEQIAEAV
jgi:two-component system nitrogen regulation sensor histidine kinase NtrY